MTEFQKIALKISDKKSFLKKKYHVSRIAVFGSVSRGEERSDSDLDLLVELSQPVGFEFFDLKDYLEDLVERKVDLVTEKALKPQLKARVSQDLKYI